MVLVGSGGFGAACSPSVVVTCVDSMLALLVFAFVAAPLRDKELTFTVS